jgi:hypothetical protein
MLQTVVSLIDDARVIIYDRNVFIIKATGVKDTQDCLSLLQLFYLV